MTPERWAAVERLYHAARKRPASDRGAYLAEACAGDADLRREIESLLAQPSGTWDPALAGFGEASSNGTWDPALAGLGAAMTPSPWIGRRLGAYQIQSLLGAGGMGEVYRARDTKLGRDVAIKILPEVFTADAERIARFERKARVLASLNHPNIAAIYGLKGAARARRRVSEGRYCSQG